MSTNHNIVRIERAKQKQRDRSLKSWYRKILREKGVLFDEHMNIEQLKQLWIEATPNINHEKILPREDQPNTTLDHFIKPLLITEKETPSESALTQAKAQHRADILKMAQPTPQPDPTLSPLIYGKPTAPINPIDDDLETVLSRLAIKKRKQLEDERERQKKNPWSGFKV